MAVRVVRLDAAGRDFYRQQGHRANLVGNLRSDFAFQQRFATSVGLLRIALTNIAPPGDATQERYFVVPESDADSLLWVEVAKQSMLTPALIADIHAAVCAMGAPFGVEICDALGYFEHCFNIFVEHDSVHVFADEEALLRAMGLDRATVELPSCSSAH